MSEKKIEEGEYVRTKEGYLGILIAINKQDYNYLVVDTSRNIRKDEYPATYLYLKNENILNHSKNIINLIETEDYVNGHRVISVDLENDLIYCDTKGYEALIHSKDIKEILTKEVYLDNCYKTEQK